MREIPFSLVQFPLYEFMKVRKNRGLISLYFAAVIRKHVALLRECSSK